MRPLLFVIQQVDRKADGGLQSITEVMTGLKNYRPVILTNQDGEMTEVWRERGWDVHVEPTPEAVSLRSAPLAWLGAYRRYGRAVQGILRSSGARVIHANDPLAFQLSLLGAKRAPGTRIALNLRDTLDPGRSPPRLKFRILFGAADHVLYLSRDMAERWRTVAANATRRCTVTYSIVDPTRYSPAPIEPKRAPVVLVPGVVWPKKGQLEFIQRVVPMLAAEGVETWFAGDFDPETDRYSEACARAAEPHSDLVRFLGYRGDMPDLIRQARVIAVPSKHEGLMRGMIEAMSCARPVVSFDVCSAEELLSEHSGGAGQVVRAGEYEVMAKRLLDYCANAEAAAEAGRKGYEIASRLFDRDRVIERYEHAYRQLDGGA